MSFFYLTWAGLIAYPAPFIIQFKFKQLVLGLQVKLAAEEDRASGLADVLLLDLLLACHVLNPSDISKSTNEHSPRFH